MALYKEDIINIELESGSIHRSWMNHAIGLGDVKANRFGVRIFRNGEAVNIGSGTCQGFFMRPDGTNLQIQGSTYTGVNGNLAWVQLPQDAYAYQGQFCLAIKLIGEGITGTMRIIDGMVDNTGTTGAVSPTSTVPTSQEIIAAYNNAVAVIDNSVRFDIDQSPTAAQKTRARTNIEAASQNDVDDLNNTFNNNAVIIKGDVVNNSSLNSYTSPGVYWKGSTRTVTDAPAQVGTETNFVLTVLKSGTQDYKLLQVLSIWSTKTVVYCRTYKSTSAFGDWVKLSTSDDLESAFGILSDDIYELSKKLSKAVHVNLMVYDSTVENGYYNEYGQITANNDSEYCTAYIRIDSGKTYKTNLPNKLQVVTYDAQKHFIERKYNQNIPTTITFDSNVGYIRISAYNASISDVIFASTDDYDYVSTTNQYGIDGGVLSDLSVTGAKIAPQAVDEGKTTFFTVSVNILNPAACEKDKFIDGSTGIKTQSGSEITHTIPVSQGDVVRFTPMSALYLAKYETNDTYVRTALSSTDSSYTVQTDGYIRFARYQSYFPAEFMVTVNNPMPTEYEAYGSYTFDYATQPESKGYVGKISKTATSMTVDMGKWRFIVNKYDNNTTRAHLWRVNNCYVKDLDGEYQRIWYDSDSDGVVHLPNEDDFLGGYHGDETQTVFKIFVDGVEYDGASTFDGIKFNEVVMYCESNVYHCNTSATPDVIAFKRNKIIRFNADGYIMENHWIAQEALTVTTAYMGMLSVQQYLPDSETVLLENYIGNDTYGIRESGATASSSQYLTDTEYFLAYGHIGIKIEDMRPSANYAGHVTYYSSGLRNKTYFDLAGQANLTLGVGDIIHAKATTYLH